MSRRPAAQALPRRLSKRSPKGEQLREIMGELIGSLEPGAALPSERELAERYGVARMTVRTEIDRLVTEGLVYRMQGRGTFVAEPRVTQAMMLSSFSEDMRERGLEPGSRILACDVVLADAAVAGRLELADGTPVIRIHRVRTADDEPMAVEEAFLPAERFAGIERSDLEHGSLFALLESRWDVRLAAADQRVVAVAIGELDATLLGVEAGHPGLMFHSVVRDEDGRPVCFAWSLFRGDRYEVRMSQVRA
ncbi:MAG TPA: GntR family transcriptional regulator [Solirubrobacteraceae bacterium]